MQAQSTPTLPDAIISDTTVSTQPELLATSGSTTGVFLVGISLVLNSQSVPYLAPTSSLLPTADLTEAFDDLAGFAQHSSLYLLLTLARQSLLDTSDFNHQPCVQLLKRALLLVTKVCIGFVYRVCPHATHPRSCKDPHCQRLEFGSAARPLQCQRGFPPPTAATHCISSSPENQGAGLCAGISDGVAARRCERQPCPQQCTAPGALPCSGWP